MNAARILAVVDEELKLYAFVPAVEYVLPDDVRCEGPTQAQQIQHAVYLLHEVRRFAGVNRKEAERLLLFVNGILWVADPINHQTIWGRVIPPQAQGNR